MIERIFLSFLLCCTVSLHAKTYYVSVDGDDTNSGTLKKPFRTIARASFVMQAGDTCYIREGNYHETIKIDNLKGTAQAPILFKAYKNEKVLLDGTEILDLKWERYKGNIYKAKIDKQIWQLFVDGKSMTSARWPNGNWYDGSVWDKTKSMAWPEKGKGSYGHHYNTALKDIDEDLTGGIILVNSGSFRTYKSIVTEHEKGSDHFKYDTTKKELKVHFSYKNKIYKHAYFLEGKLGLLDEENEWFLDFGNKTIYLWAPEGKSPSEFQLRGKTQSYAFDICYSSFVTIDGIDFFGTTFSSYESKHITVENCHLKYPSYSRRMLYDLSEMHVTKMLLRNSKHSAHNTVRNCKFEYMDGPVIDMNGSGNIVENNYMHTIDYSCTYKGGWTINMSKAAKLQFRRNTVHTAGASELYKAGEENVIEFNDLSKSGYLQNDGSLVQVSVDAQNDVQLRYNWVHNSVKQGLRFDNKNIPNSPWGENGNAHHNVAWATDRIFFKGDKHFIYNNLSFDSHANDLIVSSNLAIQGRNHNTITANNISNKFSGHRTRPGKDYPTPGKVSNNWSGDVKNMDVRSQLRDPDNLDFRPKEDSELVDQGMLIKKKKISFIGKSPDIGPYEFGDEDYWIPGFQDEIASVPVPPLASKTVKQDADLMWLPAYKSEKSDVYFGKDYKRVKAANKKSSEYKGTQKNNIYTPKKLEKGKTYYWRIDSYVGETTRKGNVWSFSVQ